MTDQLTQQREALEALEDVDGLLQSYRDYTAEAIWGTDTADSAAVEADGAEEDIRTLLLLLRDILNSTPVPSVPVSRLREIADAHFRKSVDITVSGDAAARHALISAILYSLAEEAEGDDPTPEGSNE